MRILLKDTMGRVLEQRARFWPAGSTRTVINEVVAWDDDGVEQARYPLSTTTHYHSDTYDATFVITESMIPEVFVLTDEVRRPILKRYVHNVYLIAGDTFYAQFISPWDNAHFNP